MFTILVAEDDLELRELFCTVLRENGYQALPAGDGEEALDMLDHNYVDLLISDIMMPRLDGLGLARALRETGHTLPILMITVKEGLLDKRDGFQAGVDDYMVKPVNVHEMVWRVAALLRRARINSERRLTLGETTLDCDTLAVSWAGKSVTLPKKEFFLLFKLASSPNRIFTRMQLLDELWGLESETGPHTLEVHISRLRERLQDNADFQIVTVRGLGYKVVPGNG